MAAGGEAPQETDWEMAFGAQNVRRQALPGSAAVVRKEAGAREREGVPPLAPERALELGWPTTLVPA